MTRKLELEKRALLQPNEVREVVSLLSREAKKKSRFERFSIVFWEHPELEPDVSSPYDFRIRITGKMGLFTLKYGVWRGGGREEYEFHFDVAELGSVVNLMRVLGYKWGTTTHVERRVYRYQETEVFLDKYLDDGKGILEIEKECKNKKDFARGEEEIEKIFLQWGLKSLTKKDFVDFVRYTNNKKENFFDLSRDVDKYLRLWRKKFNS